MKTKFDVILRQTAVLVLAMMSSFVAIGSAVAPALYPVPLV